MRSLWGSPSPNTTRVRVPASAHFWQVSASRRSSSSWATTGSSVAGATGGARTRRAALARATAADVGRRGVDREAGQKAANVARGALGATRSIAVAHELLEPGLAMIAQELVDRHVYQCTTRGAANSPPAGGGFVHCGATAELTVPGTDPKLVLERSAQIMADRSRLSLRAPGQKTRVTAQEPCAGTLGRRGTARH